MSEVKLERVHQIFIVQQLAMFERGVAIQKALKDEFEIDISRAAISYYKDTNPDLPKDLKKIFTKTRNDFLNGSLKIPIANKFYRLNILNKQLNDELDLKPILQNKKAQREILRQAKEESGDSLTIKQKIEVPGEGGGSLQFDTRVIFPNVEES